jgi:carboxymethylenebutenolidase
VPLAATVSYYGGGTHLIADHAPGTCATRLFFWGGLDEHIDRHIAEVIGANGSGPQATSTPLFPTLTNHHCDERPSYNAEATICEEPVGADAGVFFGR